MADDLPFVLERAAFDRAVVVGEPITTLINDIPEVRVASESVLPVGLYWFTGVAPSLLEYPQTAVPLKPLLKTTFG